MSKKGTKLVPNYHRFYVRRNLEKKYWKLKKIEASFIEMPLRMSSWAFDNFWVELFLHSLPLTLG